LLSFPLDDLLLDIKRNVIQLRNPTRHLKELVSKGRLSLPNGVEVNFTVDNCLISSLLIWKVNGYYLWANKRVGLLFCYP
jgi:hypothetical protein